MKKIFTLLLLCGLMTSCEEYRDVVLKCENESYFHPSVKEGIKSATKTYVFNIQLNMFGQETSRRYERTLSPCTIKSCKDGYTAYNNVFNPNIQSSLFHYYKTVCIKNPEDKCQEVSLSPKSLRGTYDRTFNLEDIFEYQYKDTLECSESFNCSEGYSIDSSDETLSCVATEASCNIEEMGEGASSGYKIWDEMTNEYGNCTITSCEVEYDLVDNMCVIPYLDEVYGCMDERADNFNPEATMDDQSCMCNEGLYDPFTGCGSGDEFPELVF